jgi:O-antigen ligase
MRTGGTPPSNPLTRTAGGLIFVGLAGYALVAPVSITAATITLLTALVGAVPLWLRRMQAPYVRSVTTVVLVYLAIKFLTGLTAIDMASGVRGFTKLWPYLVFMIVPLTVHCGPRRAILLRLLAWSVAAVSAYAILQHFIGYEFWRGYDLPELAGRYAALGLFDNQQTWSGVALAATLFFGTLAAYHSRDRWLFAVAGLLALGGTIASHIRGPLVGIAAGVAVLVVISGRRGRRVALAMLGVTVLAVLLSPGLHLRMRNLQIRTLNPDVVVSRIFIWKTAWAIGADRPLLGAGPGNFRQAYGVHMSRPDAPTMGHAHNEWLNEWATSGISGVIAYSALLVVVLLALWKRRHGASGAAAAALVAWTGLACAALFQCHFTDEEVLMAAVFIAAVGLLPDPEAADHDNKALPA